MARCSIAACAFAGFASAASATPNPPATPVVAPCGHDHSHDAAEAHHDHDAHREAQAARRAPAASRQQPARASSGRRTTPQAPAACDLGSDAMFGGAPRER